MNRETCKLLLEFVSCKKGHCSFPDFEVPSNEKKKFGLFRSREDEEDRESVASERSEDSLSTKSSRIIGGGSRRLGSRRNQRGMSSVRKVRHFRQL